MARYCLVWVHLVLNCHVCPTQMRLLLNQKEKVDLIFAINLIIYIICVWVCIICSSNFIVVLNMFNLENEQQHI